MSPVAIQWIAVDVAAIVLVAAVLAKRKEPTTLALRPLLTAQAVVIIASAIAASTALEPLRSFAEWTLMAAVNLGYALTCRRADAARLLSSTAIAFTTLAVVLIALRSFSSIVAMAIGLVFALGALVAALLQLQQARVA